MDWSDEYKKRATAGASGAEPINAAVVNAQLAVAEEIGRLANAVESLVDVVRGRVPMPPADVEPRFHRANFDRHVLGNYHDDDLAAEGDDRRDHEADER